MSTVASISFLPLLATTPLTGPLSMIEAQKTAVLPADLEIFATRLSEQVIGDSSPFANKVDEVLVMLIPRRRGEAQLIAGVPVQLATAWNDLEPRLKLDAQIAAAYVTGELTSPETKAASAAQDHGVIGPMGEGAENFHNPQASIAAAVSATGPLGTVALFQLQRWIEAYNKITIDRVAKEKEKAGESLGAAQLFFLSALMMSREWEEWDNEGPLEDWQLPSELTLLLMKAAENLHRAGQRRPANQYLDDVIGLSRVTVQLAPKTMKVRWLASLQEALAEKLEPRAEEARPDSDRLIASALYLLDAAANWNNAQETEAARRAFDKSVALLQLAGRLPAQAGS